MAKRQAVTFTYTVALLDEKGRVKLFLTPNYSDPGQALDRLRKEQARHSESVGVWRGSVDLLDEAALLEEIGILDSDEQI